MKHAFNNTQVEIIKDVTGNGLTFTKDGKTYTITQQAYMWDSETYRAQLECEGEEFGIVVWDIIDINCDDESNACDWDKFNVYQ